MLKVKILCVCICGLYITSVGHNVHVRRIVCIGHVFVHMKLTIVQLIELLIYTIMVYTNMFIGI